MDVHFDIVSGLKKTYATPFYMKNFAQDGQITCIEVSQYELSQDLILVGFVNKIILVSLKSSENFEIDVVSEFPFPCRCTGLAISIESNFKAIPANILFCAVGSDFKMRIYKSNLAEDTVCEILDQHKDFINDIKFDFENKYLASASDDNTVKIWEVGNYRSYFNFQLDFPAVAVQWHKDDASKLLVADKMGLITLYNVETLKPLVSFDAGKMLSSCHWSPSNSQFIASLQMGELTIWDTRNPSGPATSGLIYTEAGGYLKFSPQGGHIAALNPLEGTMKVFKTGSLEPLFSTNMYLPTNFCWHFRYSILILADDNELCIWKFNV